MDEHEHRDQKQLEAQIEQYRHELQRLKTIESRYLAANAECERLREQQQAAAERSTLLGRAAAILASSFDYQATLAAMGQLVVSYLADYCIVDLIEEDRTVRRQIIANVEPRTLELAWEVERRYPFDPNALYGPPCVVRTRLPEIVPVVADWVVAVYAQDDGHLQLLRRFGLRSYLCVPLIAGEKTLGALTFVLAHTERHYNSADLTLAQQLAERAAQAIVNARLHRAEQTARAEAQAANRTKDEFLAALSHELRTPLNSIIGFSQLLRRGRFNPAAIARATEAIERNGRLQAQLIDDLLDVSCMLRGQIQLQRQNVDLKAIVENVLAVVRPEIRSRGLTLKTRIARQLPAVEGDPRRLRQIFWNLISNAIKFTPDGGSILVQLKSTDGHICLSVRDTGVGIEADFLPHLFEIFRQADGTATRRHGGLGLGLSLVRHLIELHGGKIEVESAGIDQGSCFTVRLPEIESQAKSCPIRLPAANPSALAGLRVLVVLEHAALAHTLQNALIAQGATVQPAASIQEAMDFIETFRPDILVSDVISRDNQSAGRFALVRKLDEREECFSAPDTELNTTSITRRLLFADFAIRMALPQQPDDLAREVMRLAGRPAPPLPGEQPHPQA